MKTCTDYFLNFLCSNAEDIKKKNEDKHKYLPEQIRKKYDNFET